MFVVEKSFVKNDVVKNRVSNDINFNLNIFSSQASVFFSKVKTNKERPKILSRCAVIIDIELIVSSDL